MDSIESTESASTAIYHGKHGDKSIVLTFKESDCPSRSSLSWTNFNSKDDDVSKWTEIGAEKIVGIIPSTEQRPDTFQILAVEDIKAPDSDEKASPVRLQTFEIENATSTLIQQYQPRSDSYLKQVLASSGSTSFHVIVSVRSGIGHAKSFWEQGLLPFLKSVTSRHQTAPYEVHFTTSEQSVTELAQNVLLPAANQGKEQFIILLSGDGGVIDTLNALLSQSHSSTYRNPVLALLPMGTGNALSNSSGISNDKTYGLRTLWQGRPRELPLFRATFSSGARRLIDEGKQEVRLLLVNNVPTIYGAVVCSWGLHAALVADSDTTEYRKFGAERFKMAAKEALYPSDGSLPHPYRGVLSVLRAGHDDWQKLDRTEHGYVLSTLVSNLEAGFTISPESKPLDGVLRVVHFAPASGEDAMQIMGKAYQGGKHVEDERVGYETVSGLRIDFDEDNAHWRRICVDGTIVRVEKGGFVEVRTDVKPIIDLIVT